MHIILKVDLQFNAYLVCDGAVDTTVPMVALPVCAALHLLGTYLVCRGADDDTGRNGDSTSKEYCWYVVVPPTLFSQW